MCRSPLRPEGKALGSTEANIPGKDLFILEGTKRKLNFKYHFKCLLVFETFTHLYSVYWPYPPPIPSLQLLLEWFLYKYYTFTHSHSYYLFRTNSFQHPRVYPLGSLNKSTYFTHPLLLIAWSKGPQWKRKPPLLPFPLRHGALVCHVLPTANSHALINWPFRMTTSTMECLWRCDCGFRVDLERESVCLCLCSWWTAKMRQTQPSASWRAGMKACPPNTEKMDFTNWLMSSQTDNWAFPQKEDWVECVFIWMFRSISIIVCACTTSPFNVYILQM